MRKLLLLLLPLVALAFVGESHPMAPHTRPSAVRATVAKGNARRYTTTAIYDVSVQGAQQGQFSVKLAADWTLAIAEVTDDQIVMRGELAVHSLAFRANGQLSSAIPPALAAPHAIVLARDGRLLAIHMSPDRDGISEGIVRSLAASLQLVQRDAPHWETQETDANGEYVAAYSRSGDTVDKSKLRYLPSKRAVVSNLTSHARARFTGALLASLDLDDRMTISSGPMVMSSHSTVALALASEPRVSLADFDLAALEVLGNRAGAPDARADRELVAGATFDDLLKELAATDVEARGDVADRFAALARLDANVPAEMVAHVRDGADERTASLLLGALADAATPAAQAALVDLVGTNNLDAAHATTQLHEPRPEVTTALAAKLAAPDLDMRDASSLALGTAAARLAGRDPDRAHAIVDDVLSRLAATTDPQLQITLIRMLGNAGDARALPALRVLLASMSPDVRRVAVEALRGIVDPSVDGMIATVMHGDRDAVVRQGAVVACGMRASEACLPALDAATADHDVMVRIAIVEALAAMKVDAARAILTRLASDPDQTVRTEAQRAL